MHTCLCKIEFAIIVWETFQHQNEPAAILPSEDFISSHRGPHIPPRHHCVLKFANSGLGCIESLLPDFPLSFPSPKDLCARSEIHRVLRHTTALISRVTRQPNRTNCPASTSEPCLNAAVVPMNTRHEFQSSCLNVRFGVPFRKKVLLVSESASWLHSQLSILNQNFPGQKRVCAPTTERSASTKTGDYRMYKSHFGLRGCAHCSA